MLRRFRGGRVLLGLGMVLVLAGSAFAEQETGNLATTKLFRGISNAATGWMEIPKHMSLVWQKSGAGAGVSWGFVKGLGHAVARSVAGAYEIVTFPVPVPEGYKPVIEPEYVLSDISQESGSETP